MNIVISITLYVVLINFGDCSRPLNFLNSDIINVKQAVSYLNSIDGGTWKVSTHKK